MLLLALVFYLHYEAPPEEQNFAMVMEMLRAGAIEDEDDPSPVSYTHLSNDLIFESLPYHNVVFVGYDEKKEPKYAAYRSTNKRRIVGDCSGSKKDYSCLLYTSFLLMRTVHGKD